MENKNYPNEGGQSTPVNYWPTGNHRQMGRHLDPMAIIQAIVDYKWLILLATALATGLALFFVSVAVPTYQASATIELSSKSPNIVNFDGADNNDRQDATYIQTQVEILHSRDIAKRVINKLKLQDVSEFLPSEALETAAAPNSANPSSSDQANLDNQIVSIFLDKLTIEQIEFTPLVKVIFESESATLAADIANELSEQYIVSRIEQRNQKSNKVLDSISFRLSSLKYNVEKSETELLEFKLSNNIIAVDGAAGRLSEQELLISSSDLVNAKTSLLEVTNLRNEIFRLRKNPAQLESLPQIYNDPLVRQARLDLHDERRKLRELSNKYGDRHPVKVDAQSRIASLNNSLRSYILQVADQIENEYQQLSTRVALLETKLQVGKSSIQDFGAKKIELQALESVVATNRDIYNTFFNRLVESNSVQGLEQQNAEIAESAFPATDPHTPNKKLIVLLLAVGTLVLSSLAAVLFRIFDDSITSTRDVNARAGLKLLGIMPDPQSMKKPRKLPWSKANQNSASETINILTTNIKLADRQAKNKVIMITSSVPDEGKSTTALALAAALSKTEHVLLVDADLRKGSLSKFIGDNDDKAGLTDLVFGSVKPVNTIQHDVKNNYDFISCGTAVDQPLALLSSKAFERVIGEFAFLYDRVIVDCPPVHAVSDTKVMSKLADSVIYLIKARDTSASLVKRGVNVLQESNARVLGAIVTQVNLKNLRSFGRSYDFHGFHDYYGYAEDQKSEKVLKLNKSDMQRLNKEENSGVAQLLRGVK